MFFLMEMLGLLGGGVAFPYGTVFFSGKVFVVFFLGGGGGVFFSGAVRFLVDLRGFFLFLFFFFF